MREPYWLASAWLVTILSCGYVIHPFALAADWPGFRGPTANGVACASETPPRTWDATRNVAWRASLPGSGAGSPIVVEGCVFLNAAQDLGKQRSLLCLDSRSGGLLWTRTVAVAKEELTHIDNPYCGSTPASDGQVVVTWHGTGGLHCYSLDGESLWSRNFGEVKHLWGYGNSPIIHEGCVFLHSGVGEKMFVASIRLTDGELLWMKEEPEGQSNATPDGPFVGSWATPVMLSRPSGRLLICAQPTAIVAYEPSSGAEVWRCAGLESEQGKLVYASPLVSEELVVAMAGYQGPSMAIRADGAGLVTDSHRIWHQTSKNPQRVGSGVIVGDYIYMGNADGGTLQCIELRTGQERWRERVAGGPHWASTILADGLLFATNQSGVTRVFYPDPSGFRLVAENDLGQRIVATPAFADDQIYIRTQEQLWCIAEQKGGSL